jgi:hypothetical protein
MKLFLPVLIVFSFLQIAFAQNQIDHLSASSSKNTASSSLVSTESEWMKNAEMHIRESEYYFRELNNKTFVCANRAQKVAYSINSCGYSVEPILFSVHDVNQKWKASFNLSSIHREVSSLLTNTAFSCQTSNGYILQQHASFNVEYKNDERGLRQNFIINQKLAGIGDLVVELGLQLRNLIAAMNNGQQLLLKGIDGKRVIEYDGLKVWDANRKPVKAHMQLKKSNTLDIIVEDANATYPLTIDPLNHTAEWAGSAEGILPTILGQLAVDAAYGFSVVGLGDINGDGYDDIAIGAPGLVDVISGSGTMASVGAVFVYYGGTKGLSATPSAKLQPSTCVAGALFGFSVAAGDINDDGVNDIIVGAPMDQVTISTGGSQTATGTIGKVYAFSGAGLTSSVTAPLLTLQISGTSNIEGGVNLATNALFGYSVAVTDDLNNDGRNDIIVGSPMYAGITTGLLGNPVADVQSGGAFVFVSNGINNYNIVKLTPPTASVLGIGLLSDNVNGLLFGISVDGVGDYNSDGKPDVAVGAAAGVDLSSLSSLLSGQLLQGSTMVYYGNGAGVVSQAGATLAASSGGLVTNFSGTLANAANLFGYCVKGVKGASGARTGNILVGAPMGGTLTNLVGGLEVKTGTVSVFKQQSSSPTGIVVPDQQLNSPRNSNSILNTIQSSLLFGFSIDNLEDINCDGIGDIIIGEPASSGASLIGANVAGGSAYVFVGTSNGLYQSTPAWTALATYDASLGVNVTSLIGYSVAGAFKVKGISGGNKILVGAPGRTLDFGTGLLNMGNTMSTLFGLVAGNNGIGEAFEFDPSLCGYQDLPLVITEFNAVLQNDQKVLVNWQTTADANVNYYAVESSVNDKDWDSVTMVVSTRSSSIKNYEAIDNNPHTGISYYRLKEVDLSGNIFYSEMREIKNDLPFAEGIIIANPFENSVRVTLNSLKLNAGTMELLDLNGQILVRKNISVYIGLNSYQIDNLSVLSSGVYVLHILSGNDNYSAKLIKR